MSDFLAAVPLYNPNPFNLHVLMVLSIGGIVNEMLLPVVVGQQISTMMQDFIW